MALVVSSAMHVSRATENAASQMAFSENFLLFAMVIPPIDGPAVKRGHGDLMAYIVHQLSFIDVNTWPWRFLALHGQKTEDDLPD